jgi:hypothetical protein
MRIEGHWQSQAAGLSRTSGLPTLTFVGTKPLVERLGLRIVGEDCSMASQTKPGT